MKYRSPCSLSIFLICAVFFSLSTIGVAVGDADDTAAADPQAAKPDSTVPPSAEPNPPVVTANDSITETTENPAFQTLFDGMTLHGWRGYQDEAPEGWEVKDGVMAFGGRGADLVTVTQYEHFELSLEFKTEPGTNSGILYRVRMGDKQPYMSGLEFQIHNRPSDTPGKLDSATGALYALYPTTAGLEKPTGEWNTAKIVVKGEHIEHWLNGTKVVECDADSDDWKERVAKSKFHGWPQFNQTKKGHVALQSHGHPAWFRNIRIRELTLEP